MDFTVEKQQIRMNVDMKPEMQEHAVDSELVLPDYCPDIARVLKCKGEPRLLSKQITDGVLTIEGAVAIRVLYVDEKGEIACYQQNLPLYHEMQVGDEVAFAQVVAKMDYCNCRVINARKVEIHGAVGMRITMQKHHEVAVVSRVSGDGVESLVQEETVTTLLARCEKNMTVSDEVQISSNSIRTILRSSCVVCNSECKTVIGKAVVKGDLSITAFYQTTDGGFDTLRAQIPFSQIVDAEGVDEQADCRMQFQVQSLELRTRTGLDGECKNILVTANVNVMVEATKTFQLPMVSDCYSTRHGMCIRRYGDPLRQFCEPIEDRYVCKQTVTLDHDVGQVLDLWCDSSVEQVTVNGTKLTVNGGLNVMVLAKDQDGSAVYFEKPLDFVWEHALSQEEAIPMYITAQVQNLTYTITADNTMDLRVELQIGAQLYRELSCNVMTELTADLSNIPTSMPTPLILYYAKAGERIFDIARQYNTTCQAILSANGLSESVLAASKALLIPAV